MLLWKHSACPERLKKANNDGVYKLVMCLLVAESVKALHGKQIIPYNLNKVFLAKSMTTVTLPLPINNLLSINDT